MSMIKICDKCGTPISKNQPNWFIDLKKLTIFSTDIEHYDLCNDCFNKFKEFLKGEKK